MGGTSFEREFSLESGQHIVRTLQKAGHEVLPLDTTEDLTNTLREQTPDVAYIALHGRYGEDGIVQALLEFLGIPFVGSSQDVCRNTWSKSALPYTVLTYRNGAAPVQTHNLVPDEVVFQGPTSWPKGVNLSIPALKSMGAAGALDCIPNIIGDYPYSVKPARGGSALGITKVDKPDDLAAAMLDALSYDTEVVVEQWIDGVELAVCVIGTGDEARTLPPVQIVSENTFFDTEAHYDDDFVTYYCPVRDDAFASGPTPAADALATCEAAALEVHRAFGCRDISRVDMIWDGKHARVLEVNVSPGMTPTSLVPVAAKAAGMSFGDLLEELLDSVAAR
ncbi:MAG: ATP-grasp domain-containing protein [Coriobacteriales bacterium]|jgi:D-alanine-D-alanine ligase|nr:ATP-grasp domain-containing protein [Coriobacteriales bacterium]